MELIFLSLVLLQIKHWYIDFVNQSEEEVKYKAEYMDWRGMKHSLKQGLGTAVALVLCTVEPPGHLQWQASTSWLTIILTG